MSTHDPRAASPPPPASFRSSAPPQALWPELPLKAWDDTRATLHLWTQIVGKIRLKLTPWLNHGWHVPLYVSARGLTTSPIPCGARSFEIEFDFLDHVLDITVTDGSARRLPLRAQSVAEFYRAVLDALAALGIHIAINEHPSEIPNAIPFSQDRTHASYDPIYAQTFWRVLTQVDRVFKVFRTAYIGKASPVHFFWGSFDLAVTRFSGRRAPEFTAKVPGVPLAVMQDAYSHEVSSAGFWPGGNGLDYAAFYSYAYAAKPEFRAAKIGPAKAFYSDGLGEFLLPYDAVRTAADPDAALMAFLDSTYEAAATTGGWDRPALECRQGQPGVPRPT
jgi:Family of unknown function (DUF5996)